MFMKNKKFSLSLVSLFFPILFSANVEAASHIVVAPTCLLEGMEANYKILAKKGMFTLLQLNDAGIDQLVKAKTQLRATCGGFMDVTLGFDQFNVQHLQIANKENQFLESYLKPANIKPSFANKPIYGIRFEEQTTQALKLINPQHMWSDLETLSSYPDRYSRSENGVKAAKWIKDQMKTIAKNAARDDVTVYTVATGGSYKQPSVVAKIGDSNEAGIVIGGHMDTLSSNILGNKPGADDDGTGTVTVLEVARTLLSSGMHFKKPIYLVWYAAEEMGLVGSTYVVNDFKKKKIPIDAVMQLDMTGYMYKNDPTIWLIEDYVNTDLTKYLKTLTETYVKQPIQFTKCGYACSDHATWHKAGVAASIPFEAKFGNDNPEIHTSRDKMELLSLDHMTSFAKLAVAFAVELAEPVGK